MLWYTWDFSPFLSLSVSPAPPSPPPPTFLPLVPLPPSLLHAATRFYPLFLPVYLCVPPGPSICLLTLYLCVPPDRSVSSVISQTPVSVSSLLSLCSPRPLYLSPLSYLCVLPDPCICLLSLISVFSQTPVSVSSLLSLCSPRPLYLSPLSLSLCSPRPVYLSPLSYVCVLPDPCICLLSLCLCVLPDQCICLLSLSLSLCSPRPVYLSPLCLCVPPDPSICLLSLYLCVPLDPSISNWKGLVGHWRLLQSNWTLNLKLTRLLSCGVQSVSRFRCRLRYIAGKTMNFPDVIINIKRQLFGSPLTTRACVRKAGRVDCLTNWD